MERDPLLERQLIAGAVDQIVTLLDRPQDLDVGEDGSEPLRSRLQKLRLLLNECLDDDPSSRP